MFSMVGELTEHFQMLLSHALTQGRVPDRGIGVGPRTRAALLRLADHHPEATAELIVTAYDTFRDEHG